jgi:hypothetical protein
VVERDLAKVDVAGSTPVSRSRFLIEKPRAGEGFFNVEGPFPRMDNSRRWR